MLIGWIWSIYWGYLIVMKSIKGEQSIRRNNGPGGQGEMYKDATNGFNGNMNNRQNIAMQN